MEKTAFLNSSKAIGSWGSVMPRCWRRVDAMAIRLNALLLAACVLAATPAWSAETYPARPVRLIVPFTPGGATDVVARLIGQKLSERLGQQFVIENRPGAGTNIGTEAVIRSTP